MGKAEGHKSQEVQRHQKKKQIMCLKIYEETKFVYHKFSIYKIYCANTFSFNSPYLVNKPKDKGH